MDNKKIAGLIVLLIAFIFIMAGLIGISGHLPFIGKALMLIFSVILIAGILAVFIFAGKRKEK